MASLRDNFLELIKRIRHGREVGHASFEPIYYLIFHPRQLVEVKRSMKAWTSSLRNEGWSVETFSVAEEIERILHETPLRRFWIEADKNSPLDWERTNKSLANTLSSGILMTALLKKLESLESRPDAILLVTDIEALHPYIRIGVIESQLQGKFHVPTVFFYPGERTGKSNLKFLGFYPEDGNYRSVHVGG